MGAGWIFGGWPPPPPSEGAFVTFDAVKAALALADTPVGFNGQRISGVGAPVAAGDAVTKAYDDAGAIASVAMRTANFSHVPAPVTVLAGTTHSIPGPAAGFLRVLSTVQCTGIAASTVTATLQPSALVVSRATAVAATGAGTQVVSSQARLPIGVGETLDIANVGANSFQLWYTWFDIPLAGRTVTLVRTTFGAAPVSIIPAAPAGSYHKFLWVLTQIGGTPFGQFEPANYVFNDDTAVINVVGYYGAAMLGRSANTNANSVSGGSWGGGMDIVVTDTALQFSTAAAVATRNAVVCACYETFVGTP